MVTLAVGEFTMVAESAENRVTMTVSEPSTIISSSRGMDSV